MKSMKCNQLGGACETEFKGETWEEIVEQSKAHSVEMFMNGDQAHLDAKDKMMELMKQEGAMQKWFAEKKAEFEAL